MSSTLSGVALDVAALWFVYRLVRSPRDLGLYAVVAFLVLQLLATPQHGSSAETITALTKLLQNVAQNLSLYCLMLFFLFSARGTLRRACWEAVPPVVTSMVMALSVLTIPVEQRDQVFPASGMLAGDLAGSMRIGGVAMFYVAGSCYFLYAMSQTARWALRYAAESNDRTRTGLRAAAAGLIVLAAATGVRIVFVLVRAGGGVVAPGTEKVVDSLVPLGALIFLGGVSYPGLLTQLAVLRVWLRHWRIYHQLRPLWSVLHAAFPEDALDRQPSSQWWDWLALRRVHRRYWRRVVEIRDGLVQLSPHLADVGFDPALPADLQVDAMLEALRRQRDGVPPATSTAMVVAVPRGAAVAADVDELVSLARALPPQAVLAATEGEQRDAPVDRGGADLARPRWAAYRGWRGPR